MGDSLNMMKVFWVFPLLLTLSAGGPLKDNALLYQQPPRGSRIAGGTEAAINQFPYQVALFVYSNAGQSICGGSILSANFVLTAAHCFDSFTSADVLAGLRNIELDVPVYEHEVFPSDVIKHAQYNPTTQPNDIALVRTNRKPIVFGASVQPLPMIPRSLATTNLAGTLARIAGWGRTSDTNAEVSSRLMFIDAPIVSNDECTRTYGNVITASNICLSGANARSVCQGDSGGPLTITSGGRQVQVGIVSFGSQTGCQRGYPTVFARVSSFLDWIQTNTGIPMT